MPKGSLVLAAQKEVLMLPEGAVDQRPWLIEPWLIKQNRTSHVRMLSFPSLSEKFLAENLGKIKPSWRARATASNLCKGIRHWGKFAHVHKTPSQCSERYAVSFVAPLPREYYVLIQCLSLLSLNLSLN